MRATLFFKLLDEINESSERYLSNSFTWISCLKGNKGFFLRGSFLWEFVQCQLDEFYLLTCLANVLYRIPAYTVLSVLLPFRQLFYRDSVTRFFVSGFFYESPSPKPLIITLGSFRICSKICGYIRKSRCTTGVNYTGGKLPPVSTTPAANFATSSPCVVDTGGKLAPVSTTPAAKTVLMEYSGAGGKLIHEKNQKQKVSWHCPFNGLGYR